MHAAYVSDIQNIMDVQGQCLRDKSPKFSSSIVTNHAAFVPFSSHHLQWHPSCLSGLCSDSQHSIVSHMYLNFSDEILQENLKISKDQIVLLHGRDGFQVLFFFFFCLYQLQNLGTQINLYVMTKQTLWTVWSVTIVDRQIEGLLLPAAGTTFDFLLLFGILCAKTGKGEAVFDYQLYKTLRVLIPIAQRCDYSPQICAAVVKLINCNYFPINPIDWIVFVLRTRTLFKSNNHRILGVYLVLNGMIGHSLTPLFCCVCLKQKCL